MQKLFLLILGLIILASCKKDDPDELAPTTVASPEPIACFDTTALTIPIMQTIHFSSCSKNAGYLEWSFGDGDSSKDKTVNHQYTTPGTYKVTLKVYNSDKNKWDVANKIIKVGHLYVTRVTVTEYAPGNWDNDGSRPDIFFAFHHDSIIISKTTTANDAFPPVSWSMDWKLIPGEEVGFGTYDEDPGYNESMMYRAFDPYQKQYNAITDTLYNTFKLEYAIK